MDSLMRKFLNRLITVCCESIDEFNAFMKICDEYDLRWMSGDRAISPDKYNKYYNCIVYSRKYGSGIAKGCRENYEEEGLEIVNFKDFIR